MDTHRHAAVRGPIQGGRCSRRTSLIVLSSLLSPWPWSRAASASSEPPKPLPVTGRSAAQLAGLDESLQYFMRETGFRGGTLALMREGRLLVERGYGYAGPDETRAMPPDARMRIASVSKVFTSAAVRRLIREGRISGETRVFQFLGFDLAKTPHADPRLARITVSHLLRHRGGWNREKSFDPMFAEDRVRRTLGISRRPTADDIIRFMLLQPLQFDPGSETAYSNFGYVILGKVIEKAAGQSCADYLKRSFFEPLGLKSIEPAQATRLPKEVEYDDPAAARLNLEPLLAAGGWLGNATDLCRFLQKYWINGDPRDGGNGRSYAFFGSLPGTTSMVMQRPDGTDVAILFNRRSRNYNEQNESLRKLMVGTLDQIKNWPVR
jgi:CubicO group peptidase (beta-lactamase class C family)